MNTFHNEAEPGQIAKTVLMPGAPHRTKYIAETYLEDVVCCNHVRGMYGYTGTYHGQPVSVQGSGMGIPSMGIYAHELFYHYGAENLIRIGTAGAIHTDVAVGDIVFAMGCCTNSSFAGQYHLPGDLFTGGGLFSAGEGGKYCEKERRPLPCGQCVQLGRLL